MRKNRIDDSQCLMDIHDISNIGFNSKHQMYNVKAELT